MNTTSSGVLGDTRPERRIPFRFGTKSATLQKLSEIETGAHFCPQIVLCVREWRESRAKLISSVVDRFGGQILIVRSSSRSEDTEKGSMAGAFDSVADVKCSADDIALAVDQVIESYGQYLAGDDEVLIQPMVKDVAVSGVVFSADIATGAPYLVINYDDFSGRTDTVTGGGESKLIYLRRNGEQSLRSARFRQLVEIVYRLESITGLGSLDIEFCIDTGDRIFILQVRPLTVPGLPTKSDNEEFHGRLAVVQRKIDALMAAPEGVLGERTILGEMPDWNPAEIIGRTPTPLAASLYAELITNGVWAEARTLMGYRSVPYPLMVQIEGHPFVDVRLSLNSFVPAALTDDLVEKLVEEQLGFLELNVDVHDKIEFDVAMTCWDFNIAPRLSRLRSAGHPESDIQAIEEAIHTHTIELLRTGAEALEPSVQLVESLRQVNDSTSNNLDEFPFHELVRAIKELGTLPFSMLARHAFIAVAILRSLVARGIMSEGRYNEFLASISTVSTEFINDGVEFALGKLSRSDYLGRYGHLRPGTYDIRTPSYAEEPQHYLSLDVMTPISHPSFSPTRDEALEIDALLQDNGFAVGFSALLEYARAAIAGREKAKFEFSRGIDLLFRRLLKWGRDVGLSRDDLAFVPIDEVLGGRDVQSIKRRIGSSRLNLDASRQVRLPSILAHSIDCDVVRVPLGKPTFVTGKRVAGPVLVLHGEARGADLAGKVVAIERADPGFDWIFSHRILGLITKYGGANSHMAIRCAEFQLPAAIGCGERTFTSVVAARRVELDCAADTIRSQ